MIYVKNTSTKKNSGRPPFGPTWSPLVSWLQTKICAGHRLRVSEQKNLKTKHTSTCCTSRRNSQELTIHDCNHSTRKSSLSDVPPPDNLPGRQHLGCCLIHPRSCQLQWCSGSQVSSVSPVFQSLFCQCPISVNIECERNTSKERDSYLFWESWHGDVSRYLFQRIKRELRGIHR